MSTGLFNVIISGTSASGALDVKRRPLMIDLGNSDRIGMASFALDNQSGIYSAQLFSGNATFQIDAYSGGSFYKTIFRGTLERADQIVNTREGMTTEFTGYDYAQELLGLVSPDARQYSAIQLSGVSGATSTAISVVSGDQGMGVLTGMDLALYVSGAIGSGTVGYPVGGYTLGKPLAASITAFMNQYFGKSGDTTGSNSGQSFTFKPYTSGMTTWGTNPFYRSWYIQDGASDTNSNFWITYHALSAKHEMAWDVLKKITRQGYAIDRSGTKTQYELYVGVSGDLHLRTSGSSDFIASGISLIYYQQGTSGAQNNNVQEFRNLPWDTQQIKNYILGWFPTWTTFPFTDDYSDILSYSGGYWSASAVNGTTALSGNAPAPGAMGFISIMATNISGADANDNGGIDMTFTLWSGYTLDITRWNVSGGGGVALNYSYQGSFNYGGSANTINAFRSVKITDVNGNFIVKSGPSTPNALGSNIISLSGWMSISDTIFGPTGLFNAGTGQNGGWANSATFPDLTNVKQITIGFQIQENGVNSWSYASLLVDNIYFGFVYNYNPVIAYHSGSISTYRKRYEFFQFPYQYTDSGALDVVKSELYGKMYSRQLATIIVKDNPANNFSAQYGITPGQAFVLDAPIASAGSGQFYYYWVATSVKHELDVSRGFITTIQAYPWFSGLGVNSGFNMISYSLTNPIEIQPQATNLMPNTNPYGLGVIQA